MININGKKFAETEKEMLESLFEANGTCVGYARRYDRRIKLYNIQKKLIGIITKFGVIAKATRIDNEEHKYWYNHAEIKEIGEIGCNATRRTIESLSTKTFINDRGEREYYFLDRTQMKHTK